VALHHVLDDGQAQARAAGFARTAAVDAVEALGQARQVLGAMPGPVSVTRTRRPPSARSRQPALDAPPARGVAHRVAQQVGHGAEQLGAGAGDLEVLGQARE
jgi:hypothetical protein